MAKDSEQLEKQIEKLESCNQNQSQNLKLLQATPRGPLPKDSEQLEELPQELESCNQNQSQNQKMLQATPRGSVG